MLKQCVVATCLLSALTGGTRSIRGATPQSVGVFLQESAVVHSGSDGLPAGPATALRVDSAGGVSVQVQDRWFQRKEEPGKWNAVKPASAGKHPARDRRDGSARSDRESGVGDAARITVPWSSQVPRSAAHRLVADERHEWLPQNPLVVHGPDSVVWIADHHGVGSLKDGNWQLYTGAEGLPFDDFTCAAVAGNGDLWLGTTRGAIRFDGSAWSYRQGQRWLPGDHVHDIAAADDGSIWLATDGGLGQIRFQKLTLQQKADFYEQEIDRYNRRSEFGYVIEAHTQTPGDKTSVTHHDSDNDGLWTSMYGAGECFAWAATGDPQAKDRAQRAFEALRFLSVAPRGGSNPAPRGFIARTVVPTSEPDPNQRSGYTLEGQRDSRTRDGLWRVYAPRWPTTEDGKYYWKSDTSSDELDGHYFFYGLYYDLVADKEDEKQRVREIVRDNIDHMIERDFRLHDHEGQTRWANYSPESLNFDPQWSVERGLNSLSMLSYLATAAHITGDSKYTKIAAELRDRHGYAQNVFVPKLQAGIGTGNQSDDEMAFMCFYNLLKYEADEKLKHQYRMAFYQYWLLESPELNPFFNFCYAVHGMGQKYTDQWGSMPLDPTEDWLSDSIDTLCRFPVDRFDWRHDNSHRIDLVSLPGPALETSGRRMRVSGKVIPVDECHFNHWNRNPWQPVTGGSGRTLSCGSTFLLSYYMGLYHEFISE